MRTPQIRVPLGWVVPVALCSVLAVGCTTVSGSAADDGAATPSPISVVAPSTASDTDPPAVASGTQPVEPTPAEPTPAEPTPAEPTPSEPASSELLPSAPASSEGSDESSTAPGAGTPGASVTSDEIADPPSTPAPSTVTGKLLSLERFRSPSLNIGCLIDEGLSVRCDLGDSEITEKHDCGDGGDWGQSVGLDRGREAAMLCVSDTVMDPAAPVLAYGSSTRVGSITCTSEQDGVACVDDLDHGFRLSRASYEVR